MYINKKNKTIIVNVVDNWFEKFYLDKSNIYNVVKDVDEVRKLNKFFIKDLQYGIIFMNVFKLGSFDIENLKKIPEAAFLHGLNIIEEQLWIYSNYINSSIELLNFYNILKNMHKELKDFFDMLYPDENII